MRSNLKAPLWARSLAIPRSLLMIALRFSDLEYHRLAMMRARRLFAFVEVGAVAQGRPRKVSGWTCEDEGEVRMLWAWHTGFQAQVFTRLRTKQNTVLMNADRIISFEFQHCSRGHYDRDCLLAIPSQVKTYICIGDLAPCTLHHSQQHPLPHLHISPFTTNTHE